MNTGIAGDFLGLLAQNNLRPLAAESSVRAPEQTHATTVFAFRYRDGVLGPIDIQMSHRMEEAR